MQSLDGLIVAGDHAFSLGEINQPATGAAAKISAGASAPDSLFKLLLFGFIGGFILNLMPCVLPVISLKIFGFIQHARDSRARIFGNGLAFSAGIFAWFLGLAILMIALKSAGHEITWAFQFTNPYFVVVMSAIVLVFALNLSASMRSPPGIGDNRVARLERARRIRRIVFSGRFRDRPRHTLHRALSRHRPWIRLRAIGRDHPAHVRGDRDRNEPALPPSQRATGLASLRPSARSLDGAGEAIHGLPPHRDVALSSLGNRRGPRHRRRNLGQRVSPRPQHRLLDARLLFHPSSTRTQRSVVLVLILLLVLGSGFYFIGQKFTATKTASSLTTDGWIPFSPERLQTELAKVTPSFSISPPPGASPANSTRPPSSKAPR